jgi:hypothetical protein
MHLFKSVPGQFQLARENFHVLLFEMLLYRAADQETQ